MLQVDVLLGNLQTASDSVRFQNMVEIVDLRWVTLYNSCVIEWGSIGAPCANG